jgi:hypothetical protein
MLFETLPPIAYLAVLLAAGAALTCAGFGLAVWWPAIWSFARRR